MATKQIIPAVIKYTTTLANSLSSVKAACEIADVSAQSELLIEVSALLAESKKALKELQKALMVMYIMMPNTVEAAAKKNAKEMAFAYKDIVVPAMEALRKPVDKLEMLVDKEAWPMPSYGDLIFEV